jgi:hypothetical protein
MDWGFNKLFPSWWRAPSKEVKIEQQILLDWLQREVDQHRIATMPTLIVLRGWRNREVHDYIASYDWTARMFE